MRVGARGIDFDIEQEQMPRALENAFANDRRMTVLNKSMIALTAAFVLSSVSATFAYEDPENKIGDRYPLLEQKYSAPTKVTPAVRQSVPTQISLRQFANPNQYVNEAPENKISDRYPLLEQPAKMSVPSRTARRNARHGKHA